MAKRTKVIGRCRICGCTDDRACHGGCSWVNKEHDLCSVCDNVAWRMSDKGGRWPAEVPVYALWCVTGGGGSGCWLCECASDGVTEAPAVFFELEKALDACRRENSPSVEGSLASTGHSSCVVVELSAKQVVSP